MVETDALFRIADAAQDEGKFDLARQAFERGAALGSIECLTRLAHMHDMGIGLAADRRTAMRLYQKAWRQGHCTGAANNIAIFYRENGNHRAMFEWFKRAAGVGDGSAQLDMAKCYLDGKGVRRDLTEGWRCLAAAMNSVYITEAEREEAVTIIAGLSPRLV